MLWKRTIYVLMATATTENPPPNLSKWCFLFCVNFSSRNKRFPPTLNSCRHPLSSSISIWLGSYPVMARSCHSMLLTGDNRAVWTHICNGLVCYLMLPHTEISPPNSLLLSQAFHSMMTQVPHKCPVLQRFPRGLFDGSRSSCGCYAVQSDSTTERVC